MGIDVDFEGPDPVECAVRVAFVWKGNTHRAGETVRLARAELADPWLAAHVVAGADASGRPVYFGNGRPVTRADMAGKGRGTTPPHPEKTAPHPGKTPTQPGKTPTRPDSLLDAGDIEDI